MSSIIETDVVVIGAGCAGLECAANLYTFGLKNVMVLEAQDYLGGRIKTDFINNDEKLPLEMGATWIHGLLGNPLYKVLEENPKIFQHKKTELFSDDLVYWADEFGNNYDSKICYDLYELYKLWNLDAKAIWVNKKEVSLKSYTDFMNSKLEEVIGNDSEDVKNIKRRLLKRLLKSETAESGCSTMDLCSINQYGSYLVPYGPNYEFPGGFSKLINFIAEKIPKSCIKLNHAVKNIKFIADNNADSLMVECYNGALFKAKHVVVTSSINYLQKNYATLFDPVLLNDKKIEAIKTVKMGTVDKIFMFYDDMSFFPKNINTVHPVYLDEKNSEEDLEKYWYYKTYAFDKFYDDMLLVWITGIEADYAETLPDAEISKTLTNLMRKILANDNIPEPKKIIRTQWNNNPYILGSYSYVDVNGSAEHINNLAEPIFVNKVPRVLFAGEATHLRYYSTVHGAWVSGQREANRLLKLYGYVVEN